MPVRWLLQEMNFANDFNVKHGAYKEAADVDSYLSPAIVKAIAEKK